MTACTIRVELHNATWQNYADLAKGLAALGIYDTIRGDDGKLYRLPPAEYNYEGAGSASAVRDAVQRVAATVVKDFAVLVTEATARVWWNMKVVK
jgi:hypothetical protein